MRSGAGAEERPTVVVAGAAGFVGLPLVERLAGSHRVIALSRSGRSSDAVEWRRCDLLSGREAREGVAGADLAIYLVHSMLPTDHLVQGSFEDFDLQAADNFSRACAATGVRQIVYLGGLLPAGVPRQELSRHLRSRAEVESALGGHGVPVTVLRAGLIIGPGGSSTEILLRLARRLPVMICPAWTETATQPIALEDVLELIPWVLGRRNSFGETYDVGGPDVLSYRRLMVLAGEQLGRRPRTVSVPVISPRLSRLWISLVTGAPRALAAPLVESLSHAMVSRDRRLQQAAGVPGRPLPVVLGRAFESPASSAPRAFGSGSREPGPPVVRSVQRMSGTRLGAPEAAAEYLRWLGSRFAWLFTVGGGSTAHWSIRAAGGPRTDLLRFRLDGAGSASDRVVYDIEGGTLAAGSGRGRFEFRAVLEPGTLLCSVHDFTPRLWWPLYRLTQARVHLLVMRRFARHLRRRFPLGRP